MWRLGRFSWFRGGAPVLCFHGIWDTRSDTISSASRRRGSPIGCVDIRCAAPFLLLVVDVDLL